MKRTPMPPRRTPMARTEFASAPGVIRMHLSLHKDDGNARTSVAVPVRKRCAKSKGGCGEWFTAPRGRIQAACSPGCAHAMAVEKREKAERKDTKEKLEKLRPISYWEKRAEEQVNRYVRLRDAHLGCASCDKPASWGGQWHASHFRSVGAASAIRYHLWNINKACSVCNNYKSGNLAEYEPRLRARIGDERVDWLRTQNQITRYSVDYLKRLRNVFAKKANRLARRLEME